MKYLATDREDDDAAAQRRAQRIAYIVNHSGYQEADFAQMPDIVLEQVLEMLRPLIDKNRADEA